MILEKKEVWLIMSKDRKFVAKGTPRNRCLVKADDSKDKKRYLTYSTKGKAEAGFKTSGFYGASQLDGFTYRSPLEDFLEAVRCEMTLIVDSST